MRPIPLTQSCGKRMLPVYDALEVLGGKWRLAIIAALVPGPRRFTALKQDLPGLTAKTLAHELRALEEHRLLTRTRSEESLVAVEYALTDYGWELEPLVATLHAWGDRHGQYLKSGR